MASAFQQLVYNLSAKFCCFHSEKDCICIFRIYTEKYFCHYFSSFLFFVVYVCRQNRLKPAGMKLTCKTYDRYRLRFAGNLPPCIFSYKPHSLPSANNLPSGLTGQQSPAASSFFTEQISAFRFLFLFSFYFLFFIFFAFSFPFSTYHFFIQYTEFLFFPYFFADFCTKKQHPFLSKSRYVSSSRFIDSHSVCSENLTTSSKLSFLLRVKSASGFRQNIHLYFSISDIVLNNCDFICLIRFFIYK